MPKTPDSVIEQIVRIIYEAGAAGWSVQDKAALTTAVNLALMPVKGNFPEKSEGAQTPGKDQQ